MFPLALLGSCQILENTRATYDNYDALVGVIDAGWLPEYFPRSATEIVEGHNIDTNRVWASFKYEAKDIPKLRELCKVIFENESGIKLVCPPYEQRTSFFALRKDGTGHYLSFYDGI